MSRSVPIGPLKQRPPSPSAPSLAAESRTAQREGLEPACAQACPGPLWQSRIRPEQPRVRSLEWLPLGAWRSLVARTVRVGEVAGSNPAAPIDDRGGGFFAAANDSSLDGPRIAPI